MSLCLFVGATFPKPRKGKFDVVILGTSIRCGGREGSGWRTEVGAEVPGQPVEAHTPQAAAQIQAVINTSCCIAAVIQAVVLINASSLYQGLNQTTVCFIA